MSGYGPNSTGTAGMTISGSFPNGLEAINNNGKIRGKARDAGDNSNTTVGGSANGSKWR